jgi:polyhydroxyalkanoate synthesis regulator phasin
MTQVRLEEILSKDNVSNEELGEILGDMFISFSKHFKDLKNQMSNLCEEMDELKKEIQALENKSKLGFGIILEDEED